MKEVLRSRRVENGSSKLAPICLMSRLGDARHNGACCALLCSVRFVFDEASWEAVPNVFETLLNLGAMQLSLVENIGLPSGPEIIAFCATIFVTDAFCHEARTILPPYLGSQIVRRCVAGNLPVSAYGQRSGGANVMMCYSGGPCDSLSSDHLLAVREKMAEAFRLAHSGYQLKEFLAEPIGQEASRWMLNTGFHLRRDYSDYYQAQNRPLPLFSKRSCLVGLTKEEALAEYGSRASGLFSYSPPRFHFTHGEQAVLHRSLVGETDKETAVNLRISPWTVKKRWHAIYERVADIDSALLPSVHHELETVSRGTERRRHLLAYLREHLEELRPLNGAPPPIAGEGLRAMIRRKAR